MTVRTQQSIKVPVETLKRIRGLMTLTQFIIEKVYNAPEEERARVLATTSLDLSQGIKGIWQSGGQFREDLALIQATREKGTD